MEQFKEFLAQPRNQIIIGFVGIVGIALGGYLYFSGSSQKVVASSVQSVPTHGQTLDRPVSPAYLAATKDADNTRISKAEQTGSSAMPSLVNALPQDDKVLPQHPSDILPPADNGGQVKALPSLKPATSPANSVQQVAIDPQRLEAMKSWMDHQMKQKVADPVTSVVYKPVVDSSSKGASQGADVTTTDKGASTSANDASKLALPLPGTVVYAELISEANSDSPGPVVARVLQGRYTGALLVGSFQKGNDSLTIRFSKMSVSKTADDVSVNGSVAVDAVAVDTKYIGTAMATDVDHHYFLKIATAFVTSFFQGLGQAISSSGSTSTTNTGTTTTTNPALTGGQKALVATGAAAQSVGQIFQQSIGNQPTTIKVAAGTPIGLLFL